MLASVLKALSILTFDALQITLMSWWIVNFRDLVFQRISQPSFFLPCFGTLS